LFGQGGAHRERHAGLRLRRSRQLGPRARKPPPLRSPAGQVLRRSSRLPGRDSRRAAGWATRGGPTRVGDPMMPFEAPNPKQIPAQGLNSKYMNIVWVIRSLVFRARLGFGPSNLALTATVTLPAFLACPASDRASPTSGR